jgi:hypothetical protein
MNLFSKISPYWWTMGALLAAGAAIAALAVAVQ